jgi:RNA 3'-phosphate cyclase
MKNEKSISADHTNIEQSIHWGP